MRHLLALIMITLTACGKKPEGPRMFPFTFTGSIGAEFYQGASLNLGANRVVDSSILNVNGELKVFFDYGDWAFVGLSYLNSDLSDHNVMIKKSDMNFTYTIFRNGTYYNFGLIGRDVYLDKSVDGVNWQRINGAQPVLRHDADETSDWNQVWNVAVDVDQNGVWKMAVECSDSAPNQLHVGLCYTEANMSGDFIDFNSSKVSKQVVLHGGNPYLKILPGRGVLIVHGEVNNPYGVFGAEWYVTASTLKDGDTSFITHQDKFIIGTPGIHDCDPHVAEFNGEMIVNISVDQSHVSTAKSRLTQENLFDQLTQ